MGCLDVISMRMADQDLAPKAASAEFIFDVDVAVFACSERAQNDGLLFVHAANRVPVLRFLRLNTAAIFQRG